MSRYLTLAQYKRCGDGVEIGDATDVMLATLITRAEASIDAHMGFDAKRGGFEPHFLTFQSPFDEHTRRTPFPHAYVPLRQITRYRIQVSNLSTTGAGFFANINADDCVINNDGQYVEIVPLQAVTYALSPVLLQLGLNPPIVEMDCEIGYYIPIFGEIATSFGDGYTFYVANGFLAQTYDQALANQPNLLPPVPPNVYVNGTLQTSSAYTVNYIEGSIIFTSIILPTETVTVDYTYTIPNYVAEATTLQTSFLLGQRNLNKMGMYAGLFQMRTGEQEIGYPRFQAVASKGRAQETPLCDKAAACLARFEGYVLA